MSEEMTRWAIVNDQDVVISVVERGPDLEETPPGSPGSLFLVRDPPADVAEGWVYDRKGERFVEPQTLRNLSDMHTFLDNSIASNTEFLAVQSPNAQQQLTQLRRLTFQVQYLIRIERDRLESTT